MEAAEDWVLGTHSFEGVLVNFAGLFIFTGLFNQRRFEIVLYIDLSVSTIWLVGWSLQKWQVDYIGSSEFIGSSWVYVIVSYVPFA